LGTVLVDIMVTQNLVSIIFYQFNRVKGRFASALDPLEPAAMLSGRLRLIAAVKARERSVP